MLNIKNINTKKENYFEKIIRSFGLTEKTIFIILAIILIISGLSLLWRVNLNFVTEVPAHGGSLSEGQVGSPSYINPVLELSDADRDLTYLIYSGLMRATANGDLIPDLAESYTISPDGLTYTFKIRENAFFHDGERVTADDVEYTIQRAQDINIPSPKKPSWAGVTIEKISEKELIFKLKQPYSPFLENTTLGILPKHIWGAATANEFSLNKYNIEPIGSGPYMVSKINKSNLGIPTSYELKAFNNYTLGEPYISTLKFNFYPNEKSLSNAYSLREIDSTISISPQNLSSFINTEETTTEKISLPRIFGVFFNQNQAKIFLNKEVRQALDMTVDKNRIISEALGGFGEKIDSPLPNGVLPDSKEQATVYNKEEAMKQAKEILTKAGWKFNDTSKIWEKKISKTETQKLTFTLSTPNATDVMIVANILKDDWALLGVPVTIEAYDLNDLKQSIISTRKYDTLLFAQAINRSLDLFAFWHSSQRNTGNNVAMYTNSKADTLLEEARQTSDKEERLKKYTLFKTEIKNDIPAIFIYSPESIYILPKKVLGFKSGLINNNAERFEGIYKWYIETDKIWNFLIK